MVFCHPQKLTYLRVLNINMNWKLYLIDTNPLYFIYQLNCKLSHLWPLGASSSWLRSPINITIVIFCNFLEILFVRSCKIPTPYYTIPAPGQISALSQEAFVSFIGSYILRLQSGCLEYWASHVSRPLSYV